MKFYIIYEENALATIESDIEGPYKTFKEAETRSRRLPNNYDVCVIAQVNGEWCRLEEVDNEILYKPLEKDNEYWLRLA